MVSSGSSRCKLDLENVLVTLEDQELKGKVELMKSLQDVILELQVSDGRPSDLRVWMNPDTP